MRSSPSGGDAVVTQELGKLALTRLPDLELLLRAGDEIREREPELSRMISACAEKAVDHTLCTCSRPPGGKQLLALRLEMQTTSGLVSSALFAGYDQLLGSRRSHVVTPTIVEECLATAWADRESLLSVARRVAELEPHLDQVVRAQLTHATGRATEQVWLPKYFVPRFQQELTRLALVEYQALATGFGQVLGNDLPEVGA